MGLLVRMCATCGHYHSRLLRLRYCTEPKCACPEGPSPTVVAAMRRQNAEAGQRGL